MGMRRRGRELALRCSTSTSWRATMSRPSSPRSELQQAPAATREFAAVLVRGTIGRRDEIDARLAEQADNWRLDRMAAVDRNILRLAMYELLFAPTPHRGGDR